jgi:hypothetical protein
MPVFINQTPSLTALPAMPSFPEKISVSEVTSATIPASPSIAPRTITSTLLSPGPYGSPVRSTVEGAICTPEEFAKNLEIDFSLSIKKKGSIDYLPWAEIVRTLHRIMPDCTYGFKESVGVGGSIIHYTPTRNAYFRPYLTRRWMDEKGNMLIVTSPPGFFPVSNMASRHKAMEDPDIRAIDNCLRRAIAKEIGLHTGIGLQLWADSDPFDEVEEEPALGTRGVKSPAKAASGPAASAPTRSPKDALEEICKTSGVTGRGRKTIAVAARVGSWELIPDEKAPKIIAMLQDPDNVKLFNSGRNTAGKVILPLSHEEEIKEIVQAFQGDSP